METSLTPVGSYLLVFPSPPLLGSLLHLSPFCLLCLLYQQANILTLRSMEKDSS